MVNSENIFKIVTYPPETYNKATLNEIDHNNVFETLIAAKIHGKRNKPWGSSQKFLNTSVVVFYILLLL